MQLDAGDLAVAPRLRVRLGHVQLVVDVRVGRPGVRAERVQDLARELDVERAVQQHLARVGIGDESALVADDRRVHVEHRRDAPRALEHAARREEDVDPAPLDGAHRVDRPLRRAEGDAVEDRPVEIRRDRADGRRIEPGRQHRGVREAGYLPATAATYAATSFACWPLSSPAGMILPPLAIWRATRASSGLS